MKLIIILLLLISCDDRPQFEKFKKITDVSKFHWKMPEGLEVVKVKKTITVKAGKTFDGKNRLYKWVGFHKKYCHWPEEVSEKEPAMFVLEKGATIKNMYIECSLDAFKAASNTTFDNLRFTDVEEDAISFARGKKITNVMIKNSIFVGCQDKAIQVNPGNRYITLLNNKFYDCRSPVKYDGNKTFTAIGNYFYNTEWALRTTEGGKIVSKSNKFEITKCAHTIQKGTIEVKDATYKYVEKERCTK